MPRFEDKKNLKWLKSKNFGQRSRNYQGPTGRGVDFTKVIVIYTH